MVSLLVFFGLILQGPGPSLWLWANSSQIKSKNKARVQVHSEVDTNEVAYGETLTLRVVVESNKKGNILPPQLPPLKAFDVLRNWASSSVFTQVIHDSQGTKMETTRKKTFSYELQLKKSLQQKKAKSSFHPINPIEVQVGGKKFLTQKISIKALSSAQARQRPSRKNKKQSRGWPPGFFSPPMMEDWMDPFSGQKKGTPFSQEELDKSFFVHLDINKTKAFVGEMLDAKWYIYTLGQIRRLERVQFPKLKGFWKEEIESAPHLRFKPAKVNGLPYQRALLAAHRIFPLKTGEATVDSYQVKAEVLLSRKNSQSPLGNFFAKSYSLSRRSEALEIEVLPLPPLPPGSPFVEGVGSFEMSASVKSTQVAPNEPFAFKVRFSGKGNAKRIKAPPLNLPPQLKLYNQSSQAKFLKNGTSYKEFEFLLIPREPSSSKGEGQGEDEDESKSEREGERKKRKEKGKNKAVVLNPLKVRVFNPELKKYHELTTSAIPLQIMEGSPSSPSSQAIAKRFFSAPSDGKGANADGAQEKGLPPLLSSWQKGEPPFWAKPLFAQFAQWGFWLGLTLLTALGILFYAYREQLLFPPRKKTRREEFQERWQKTQRYFREKNWPQLGADLCNLVYFTLLPQDRGGLASVSSSQVGNLETLLQDSPPSVQKNLKQPLMDLTHFFQQLSFKQHRSQGPLSLEEEQVIQEKMQQLKRILLQFPYKGFH